ncbi:MAG: pilus assembly protein [Clostridiales bacterium GWF2_38_85]|nr:MAG: pilus assembly protein [Clostridiales bacterium GWF2_38_85]
MKKLVNFFKDENGQGMVEYGLIIGLIAIVVIAGLVILGPKIKEMFVNIGNNLDASGTVS